jgi:hypothetical protein
MGWVQHIDYIVEREESHWTVSFHMTHCGCFHSRRGALQAALADAARVRRLGHHVRVLVRYADGRLHDVRLSLPSADESSGCVPALAN